MLHFDDHFASDSCKLSCLLWASGPKGRVRFDVGTGVLDFLGGGNPVHDWKNLELCIRERAKIELACRRAYATRPGSIVELQPADFAG